MDSILENLPDNRATAGPEQFRESGAPIRAKVGELLKNPWVRGLLILALALFLVWQRGIWAGVYERAQTGYELNRKGTDYRKSASFSMSSGKAIIRYPFYWQESTTNGKLILSVTRYTGAVNEMIFEAVPGDIAENPSRLTSEIKAIKNAKLRSTSEDSTLQGIGMRIYRYGVGNETGEGYHNYVVALLPGKKFKVTMLQFYETGAYVEDDIATTRMWNVVYGLRFSN